MFVNIVDYWSDLHDALPIYEAVYIVADANIAGRKLVSPSTIGFTLPPHSRLAIRCDSCSGHCLVRESRPNAKANSLRSVNPLIR